MAVTTKICPACREVLPATGEYFSRRGRHDNRLDSWCRNCRRIKHNAWAKTEKGKEAIYAWVTERKLEVLEHYSATDKAACECCEEETLEFLTIDHINGGGTVHRREINMRGRNFYDWLRRQGYPPGYRVLCFNCNQSLGMNGYCPHGTILEADGR